MRLCKRSKHSKHKKIGLCLHLKRIAVVYLKVFVNTINTNLYKTNEIKLWGTY